MGINNIDSLVSFKDCLYYITYDIFVRISQINFKTTYLFAPTILLRDEIHSYIEAFDSQNPKCLEKLFGAYWLISIYPEYIRRVLSSYSHHIGYAWNEHLNEYKSRWDDDLFAPLSDDDRDDDLSGVVMIKSSKTVCHASVIDSSLTGDDAEILYDVVTSAHCLYDTYGIYAKLKMIIIGLTCCIHMLTIDGKKIGKYSIWQLLRVLLSSYGVFCFLCCIINGIFLIVFDPSYLSAADVYSSVTWTYLNKTQIGNCQMVEHDTFLDQVLLECTVTNNELLLENEENEENKHLSMTFVNVSDNNTWSDLWLYDEFNVNGNIEFYTFGKLIHNVIMFNFETSMTEDEWTAKVIKDDIYRFNGSIIDWGYFLPVIFTNVIPFQGLSGAGFISNVTNELSCILTAGEGATIKRNTKIIKNRAYTICTIFDISHFKQSLIYRHFVYGLYFLIDFDANLLGLLLCFPLVVIVAHVVSKYQNQYVEIQEILKIPLWQGLIFATIAGILNAVFGY